MSIKIIKNKYHAQAELLLSVLPVVMEEKIFSAITCCFVEVEKYTKHESQ